MSRGYTFGGPCRLGHVLTPANTEWYETKASKAIRCLECAAVCFKGVHIATKRNTAIRPGRGTKMCLDCAKEAPSRQKPRKAGSKKNAKPQVKTPEQKERYQQAASALKRKRANITENVDARGNMVGPIRYEYLSPKGAALEALNELNKSFEEIRTPCFDKPEEYMDWDEESPPTTAEAETMCSGCPVMKLCEDYGRKSRDRGVWGGIVVLDSGKIQR